MTFSAAPLRRRLRGGASYLSPLSTGPVPRFFSADEDAEVVSLLGEATRLISGSSEESLPKRAEQSSELQSSEFLLGEKESGAESFVPGLVAGKEDLEAPREDLPEVEEVVSAEAERVLQVVEDPEVAQTEIDAGAENKKGTTEGMPSEATDDFDSTDVGEATGDLDDTDSKPETLGVEGQGDKEEASAEALWAEAFAEQHAAEGKPTDIASEVTDSDLALNAVVPAEVSESDPGEMIEAVSPEEEADPGIAAEGDNIESMWAEAFAEQEAAEDSTSEGPKESLLEDSEKASASEQEADNDDIASLWDEAFSEQAAAEQESESQAGGAPETEDGGISDFDESGIEKMWDEALAESSASETEVGGGISPEDTSGGEDEKPPDSPDIVSQEDLNALLSGVGEEPEHSPPRGRDTQEPPVEVASLEIDEDEEEIEAFVVDEEEGSEFDENEGVAASVPSNDVSGVLEKGGTALQKRFVAGLTDFGVIFLAQLLFMAGTHLIIGQVVGSIFSNMEALVLTLALDLVVLFLLTFLYSVYFVGGWGQTPGQKLTGLNVVDLNNQPVGYMQAVLRYFGTLAAVLPGGLGLLLPVLDSQGRGLGDRLAGTRAVYQGSVWPDQSLMSGDDETNDGV